MGSAATPPDHEKMTIGDTDYLQATPFVDCGNAALQAFARKAVGEAQTPKDKAIALYAAVRELDPI